jgi:uncharacterized protein (UPF0276 family)
VDVTLIGAGFRPELEVLFSGDGRVVECAELIANRYFGNDGVARPWELEALEGQPLILHGLSGNVASVTGPSAAYLERIDRLARDTHAAAYSDHLAFTGTRERDLGHLAPNLFDDELLDCCARHVETIARATGRRVRLENLATTVTITGSAYTPEEFYLRLLEASDGWDCLVDLTNIWINSQNRSVDPVGFIDAIPPERIGYVHLAGGQRFHGELVDSHSQAVHPEVFDLLAYLLERAAPEFVIIERDSNWTGAVDEVRADLATARSLVAASDLARATVHAVHGAHLHGAQAPIAVAGGGAE